MLPEVAVMFVVWVTVTDCAVAKPLASIVAAVGSDEFQVADVVRSTVPPPWIVPIAVNC